MSHFLPLEKAFKSSRKSFNFRRIRDAYFFAYKAHLGQKRKSGEEYIIHPVTVAETLLKMEADEETVVSALLHDVIEDTSYTKEDIEEEFGALIAQNVFLLSNGNISNDPLETALALLQNAPKCLLIKIADRLHNIQTLEYMPPEKQYKKAKETLLFFVPIARHLHFYEMAEELERLSLEYIAEYEN